MQEHTGTGGHDYHRAVWKLLNTFVCVLGLAALGTGAFWPDGYCRNSMIGVGTALLATGFAASLTLWVVGPSCATEMQKAIQAALEERVIIRPRRATLTGLFESMMGEAREIEVAGVSLRGLFPAISMTTCVDVIRRGATLKLLLLSPDCKAAEMRAEEEGYDLLRTDIRATLGFVKSVYKKLQETTFQGSLEVRLYETPPAIYYFRADKRRVVGLYPHHTTGYDLPCIEVREDEQGLSTGLQAHFDALWRESESRLACLVARGACKWTEKGDPAPLQSVK